MKKVLVVLIILLFAASISLADAFYLPEYYTRSDFLSSTPGAAGDASGAIFNPAIWGLMKGPEVQFYWNDLDKTGTNINNWALVSGGQGLGFSMQHWDYGEKIGINKYQRYSMNDFTIGLGGGTQEFSTGFSYSWTKGDQAPGMLRDNTLSAGVISRPCRYASTGLAGHYALSEGDMSGVLDVGIRPLGTPMLTVFADAALASNETIDDLKWSAGASVEPLAGIALSAKYFENESVMLGITWTMGVASLKVMPHFNKDFEQTYNTYGVRVGFPKKDSITPIAMKDKFYYDLTFDSGIKYQRYKYFDKKGHTLMELLETLDQIKDDPRFSGLVIKITEDMYGSPEVLWEVREKMKELKANGKKIVVFLERGDMMEYYLASVADKIMVDPSATVGMMGFSFGRSYYKRALEKLGIGFDEWRFFKYKSALEGFSQTEMSEGDREQLQAIADGFYEIFRKDICESRGISHDEFDNIVDNVVILTADSLIAYNLADTTGRWDEMNDLVKEVDGEGKARIGNQALMAMTVQDDMWGIQPKIAIIYGLGPCAMNYGLNARRLGPVIERARNDKNIKAVVFRADSPGGDILPSDIVAVELKKTAEKKPVIVTQGQVAGSGGYWISMYGDKILASPWTITGSIGVIGGWFYNDGFNDKLGMDFDKVMAGKHSDLGKGAQLPVIGFGLPDRNLTQEERDKFEKHIRLWYDDFVTKVADGREMDKDAVHNIAQGRIWTGTTGKEIGLIDEIGGMEMAIQMARDAAKIKPDQNIDIVEMPGKGKFNPAMFQPKVLGVKLTFGEEESTPEMDYIRLLLQAEGRGLVLMPPQYMVQ